MKTLSARRVAALAGAALVLAACSGSGEPSPKDMLVPLRSGGFLAIQAQGILPDRATEIATADLMDTAVVEKQSCKEAPGRPGFICDFRVAMIFNGQIKHGPDMSARFYKTDSGWKMAFLD